MAVRPEQTTFLLVEDDPLDAARARGAFERAGRAPFLQVVGTAMDAMRYLKGEDEFADRNRFPLPGIVLLDLRLPLLDGLEFLKWLRFESPGGLRVVPVMVMSFSSNPDDMNRAYAAGANSFLVKPVHWDQFGERLRALGFDWPKESAILSGTSPPPSSAPKDSHS